jgi:hypothetical protein
VSTTSDSPNAPSARASFYVEEGCCTSGGVPQLIAPELVGWTEEKSPSCYWIRQPETADEVERATKIIHTQELGCHRYAGKDPAILERLPREQCDFFCPESAFSQRATFGPSEVLVKLSLIASQEADGVLKRVWRWMMGRGSAKCRGVCDAPTALGIVFRFLSSAYALG